MTPVWLFTDFSFIKWNDDIYFNRQYGAVFFFISETVVFQDWETPDPYISPLFFSNHKEEIFRRSEWLFEKKIGAFVRFSKQFAQLVFFGLSTLRFFPCPVASENPSSFGKSKDYFPTFAPYLTPLSHSKRTILSAECVTLYTTDSSCRNLKIHPDTQFELLFRVE